MLPGPLYRSIDYFIDAMLYIISPSSLYVQRTHSTHISAIFFSIPQIESKKLSEEKNRIRATGHTYEAPIWVLLAPCVCCVYIECARLNASLKWWAKILFLSPFVCTGACIRCALLTLDSIEIESAHIECSPSKGSHSCADIRIENTQPAPTAGWSK